MESNEISVHEVRIWLALECGKWMTNSELAKAARVAERTATNHTRRLVSLGLLDMAELFPGHRFRISDKADKRNSGYFRRLQRAKGVFGLSSVEGAAAAPVEAGVS